MPAQEDAFQNLDKPTQEEQNRLLKEMQRNPVRIAEDCRKALK